MSSRFVFALLLLACGIHTRKNSSRYGTGNKIIIYIFWMIISKKIGRRQAIHRSTNTRKIMSLGRSSMDGRNRIEVKFQQINTDFFSEISSQTLKVRLICRLSASEYSINFFKIEYCICCHLSKQYSTTFNIVCENYIRTKMVYCNDRLLLLFRTYYVQYNDHDR